MRRKINLQAISELDMAEQRTMQRWINQDSHLAELSAQASRRRIIRATRDEEENDERGNYDN